MDRTSVFYQQVQLLVQLLPLVAEEVCFALKSGTAINLFVRDLPRLSVDIDLVYLPMNNRDKALDDITRSLSRISKRIADTLTNVIVFEVFKDKTDALRLIIGRNNVKVKIELSPVLRGTVYEPEILTVCEKVEDEFGYAEMRVVALSDLYAGKICAALDRQHPRDLFDVKYLLENEGITEEIKKAFLVYLISHPRPIAELLNPTLKEIKHLYEGEFAQMEEKDVSLDELELTRKELIRLINTSLTKEDKHFLLSFKNKKPDWRLLNLNGVENLPAVKWKLMNLDEMKKSQHQAAYEKLSALFN